MIPKSIFVFDGIQTSLKHKLSMIVTIFKKLVTLLNTIQEETMTQARCLDLGPNDDLSVLFGS